MPPIFDAYQNLSDMLFDDPLLVFAIEELGAVITLPEPEKSQQETALATKEVLS